jgi:transcriptional regulator with XRE-family HTH domain
MKFGERLIFLREQRGMSQEDLRDESGLSLSHIVYLERDSMEPGPVVLDRLATALRVEVTDLHT